MRSPHAVLPIIAVALTAPLWCVEAAAQIMSDPTRPAAEVFSAASGEAAPASPVLQSVMITPTTRLAIIAGQTVKLGGKFGEARVVKISESEVVLRSATGTETLRMYPDVNMQPIVPATPVSKKRAGRQHSPAANTRGKQG